MKFIGKLICRIFGHPKNRTEQFVELRYRPNLKKFHLGVVDFCPRCGKKLSGWRRSWATDIDEETYSQFVKIKLKRFKNKDDFWKEYQDFRNKRIENESENN